MKNNKTVGLLLVLAVVAVAALFFYVARYRWAQETAERQEQSKQEAKTKTRVAMKWLFAGTMSPYFAAQRNQIFEKAGLDVTLLPGGPESPSVRQVLLNNADFGITGAHELAKARSEEQPVKAIAVIFKTSPGCLASLPASNIRVPQNLSGKKVEMTSGDNTDFEFRAMLARNGVDYKSVTVVPFVFRYDRLLNNQTDAAVVYANDQAIDLSQEREISLLCPSDFGITPYADVLFTREDIIEKNPKWVEQVVSAFLEAWEWSHLNRESTVKYFLDAPEIKGLNLQQKTQMAVLETSLRFVLGKQEPLPVGEHLSGIGVQETARWQETIDLLKQYGSAQRLPTAESCFTNRWVNLHELQSKDPQAQSK